MTKNVHQNQIKKKRIQHLECMTIFRSTLGVTFMSLCYNCWPSFKSQLSVLSDDHVALFLLTFVTVKVSFFPSSIHVAHNCLYKSQEI